MYTMPFIQSAYQLRAYETPRTKDTRDVIVKSLAALVEMMRDMQPCNAVTTVGETELRCKTLRCAHLADSHESQAVVRRPVPEHRTTMWHRNFGISSDVLYDGKWPGAWVDDGQSAEILCSIKALANA